MPECKKCLSKFPNRIKIKGEYHNMQSRKYCLICSPYGLHNTQPIIRDRRFDIPEGYNECNICSKIFKVNEKSKKRQCFSCIVNKQKDNRKRKLVKYKGGKCQRCGYNKSFRVLSFHHRDPATKLFQISGNHTRKWSILIEEVNKCDLLCSNCHIEVEEELLVLKRNNSQKVVRLNP